MLKIILKFIISLIVCLTIMFILVIHNQYNFISFLGGVLFGGLNILIFELED